MEKEKVQSRGKDLSECPQNVFYNAPIPIREDHLFIGINRCGSTIETPKKFFVKRDEAYKYNNIHFITNGRGTLVTQGKTYELQPGSVFILSAHQPHTYYCDPNYPLGLLWIEYTGGDSQRLTHRIASLTEYAFAPIDFLQLIYECVDIINNVNQPQEETSLAIYSMLIKIYTAYINADKKKNEAHEKIMNYIEEHLGEELSLPRIAKAFGYNPTYFSGLFKQISGMGYQKYILQRKITQGCTLLTISTLSVEQISQELGFYDTSHFIHRFKATMGMSPTEYRKLNPFLSQNSGSER